MALVLKNPHSVLAVLSTRPQDVSQIMISSLDLSDGWESVAKLARVKGIPISSVKKGMKKSPRYEENDGGRTGVAEATVRERSPVSAEELFSGASQRAGGKGLWLALDCLQDPHNLGAIFRAAAFFGVQGILMTLERSASLTSTVYDVASGGVEYVPFVLQTNLIRGFEVAKEAGLWILGTSEYAHDSSTSIPRDRPWLMVLGNEEKGMRRLTQESCDLVCKVEGAGKVTSLNVSVAAGVLISQLSC